MKSLRAIFVSYRRSDTQGEAGRLFDDLVTHFGEQKVFMDVSGIEAGRDFRKAIEESVANCGVLLVVMGPLWVTAKNEAGVRRLDDPADFVREEVTSALRRDIPVIPVLVRGAEMPRPEQLPDCLQDLAYRNCVELSHARWKSDVQLLVDPLRRLLGSSAEVKPATASREAGVAALPPLPSNREDVAAPQLDAATLQRISRELAFDIGLIADVVVKRAAPECSSTKDLCLKVAEEIESPQQRENFLRKMGATPSLYDQADATIADEPIASPGTAPLEVKTVSEPKQVLRRPSSKRPKHLFSLVIVVTAVVLVVVVVVGRRILAPEKLGSSAATMSSMQPTSEAEGDPDKAHAAISQVPTENSESSSTNRGSGSEAGPRQRVRVPAEVAQELLTTQIMPAYPTLARQAHVQGMVVLDVDISKGGAIESLRTISGHPMLVPAAIDAVKQWRYKPYLLNGEPVSVETRVTVSFNLSNG